MKLTVNGDLHIHGDVHVHRGPSALAIVATCVCGTILVTGEAIAAVLAVGAWIIARVGDVLSGPERMLGGGHKRLVYSPFRLPENNYDQTKTTDVHGASSQVRARLHD